MQAILRTLTALALAGAATAAVTAATLPPPPAAGAGAGAPDGGFVVIAHPGVAKVDAATLHRLYTGRAIEAGGQPVSVVNLAPGAAARDRFLALVLGQDNDRYVAYWTVRRHVGKGIPPREFRTPAEVVEHVRTTPGAIGYVPAAEAKGAPNVVYRP